MVPYGLGKFAVVARAEYKRLCLCPNNFDVRRPRPIISGDLLQNIILCKVLSSNASHTRGWWRGCAPKT